MPFCDSCLAFVSLQVRDLIYREILEYHPQMLADYLAGGHRQPNFVYPSAGALAVQGFGVSAAGAPAALWVSSWGARQLLAGASKQTFGLLVPCPGVEVQG